jgi:hypothetical protein
LPDRNFTNATAIYLLWLRWLLYALNILDANVDAALIQFNVDENLSVRPFTQCDVTLKTIGSTFITVLEPKY